MTTKQFDFINTLLKEKDYEYNTLISAFKSGYDLSSKDASEIISQLLASPKKVADQYTSIKKALYRICDNKKSAKNAAILREVCSRVQKNVGKFNAMNLTNDQYDLIADLVK